jgi:hypothetical protein
MENKTLKTGKKSSVKRPKKNRSGNPLSVNLFEAYRIVTDEYGVKIDKAVNDNLIALTEIRDNSIHFVNDDLLLSLKIQELGSASLQNYLHLVSSWYGDVLSVYNFYLMPLSFFRDFNEAPGISLNSSEKKVLEYIRKTEETYDGMEDVGEYNLTLRIEVKFQKVKSTSGLPVQISNNPNATAVFLSEDDFTDKYPWDYDILSTRLSMRYSNFKMNARYHELRKQLEQDKRFAYERLLNPKNQNGGKKTFYSPNIQREFDKHYSKVNSQSIAADKSINTALDF